MDNNFQPGMSGCLSLRKRLLLLVTLSFAAFSSNMAAAMDSNYLNQLDSEASGTTAAELASSNERAKHHQERFETILKSERSSTYAIYSKLSDDNKTKVAEDFASKKRLSRASQLITELYFKEK
ncbi:hypothetical protein MNBD_GAMMA13-95 [hydrothermal vent metagenome]|uniref:Uncharacterized protein n=1 Tax=hydrothermal vent metagenome TaxID=652676 RepID=A0A3B0YRV5_9ZZZZ